MGYVVCRKLSLLINTVFFSGVTAVQRVYIVAVVAGPKTFWPSLPADSGNMSVGIQFSGNISVIQCSKYMLL